MDPDSSLTDLFKNALADASKVSNLPTTEDDTQVVSVLFSLCFVFTGDHFESIRIY